MSELKPDEPKKKPKGAPTWVWFVGTFAIVSLLGNVVFGGNTWVTTSSNFVASTYASLFPERDSSQDNFCLSGAVSAIDRDNAIGVIVEADALVGATARAISDASSTSDLDELATAIGTVREAGPQYLEIGQRLQTATDCADPEFENLLQEFGGSLVELGENFSDWDPETLTSNPLLLVGVTPLIESTVTNAQDLIKYLGTLK
jgi:hypothetical protein